MIKRSKILHLLNYSAVVVLRLFWCVMNVIVTLHPHISLFEGGLFMCWFFVILPVIYLGNLWDEDILKRIVFGAGDDKSVVHFSSYFVCVWTQAHPQGAQFVCGCLFHGQAILISSSPLSLGFLCRYPIQSPRPGCYGDREDSPGVRNYGDRSPDELFDVYCFAKQLQGRSQEPQP